jgi:hypothetical protein
MLQINRVAFSHHDRRPAVQAIFARCYVEKGYDITPWAGCEWHGYCFIGDHHP